MWLMISISFLGFCCSDLALDASLEVTADIIPIEISSKPATQFIHKFKYTHYQVRRKNIKTHLLPFPTPFLTRDHSTPRCVTGSHRKLGQEKLSRTTPEKITAEEQSNFKTRSLHHLRRPQAPSRIAKGASP